MSPSRDKDELRELLARVREIEIRSRRLADSAMAGQYRTAFRGTGIEFEEVREYAAGDDVRAIDWNVTARTGRLFIKKYREERERNVLIAIDVSASQLFGSKDKTRKMLAAELAAVFSLSALSSKDKIGCLLFSDRIEQMIMPKRGRTHVLRIIRDILGVKPEGRGTDISLALDHINQILPRKTIIILMSDFFTSGYEKALQRTALRHDLVPIILRDPAEMQPLGTGLIMLEDAETGTPGALWLGNKALVREYREQAIQREAAMTDFFRKHRIDHITIGTGDAYSEPLMSFFRRRVARQ
jgi:uncharacterized protein (DUF58 family)